jgi:hypothetical protein
MYMCSRLISYVQPDDRAPALRQFSTLSTATVTCLPVGARTPTQIDAWLGTAGSFSTTCRLALAQHTVGDESLATFDHNCDLVIGGQMLSQHRDAGVGRNGGIESVDSVFGFVLQVSANLGNEGSSYSSVGADAGVLDGESGDTRRQVNTASCALDIRVEPVDELRAIAYSSH